MATTGGGWHEVDDDGVVGDEHADEHHDEEGDASDPSNTAAHHRIGYN